MAGNDDVATLRGEIDKLLDDREQLEELLTDAQDYLTHKPKCARLLTKKDCDCGLVELQTRVHHELEHDDEDEADQDDTE